MASLQACSAQQGTESVTPDTAALQGWPDGFVEAELPSTLDGRLQKAVVRSSTATEPMPLLVVLHSWSGDYTQTSGSLAEQAAARNWHYVHPDFRGPNRRPEACCSDAVLSDLDDAVTWALQNLNVDPARIHVIGSSGGGYATLCMALRTSHRIRSFNAWVPITDLEAWYYESKIRGTRYADDILACTGSGASLDAEAARSRSPMHWPLPPSVLQRTQISIYAGVRDGYDGSVPIAHSLRFYNRLAGARGAAAENLVGASEMATLLSAQWVDQTWEDTLGTRTIVFKRSHDNLSVTIFDGGHEMLENVALELLPDGE